MLTKNITFVAITVFFAMSSYNISFAQEEVKHPGQPQDLTLEKMSFTIIENGSVPDIKPYVDALNNANFDKYRLLDGRRILKFNTGLQVELYSANELYEKYGKQVDHKTVQKMGSDPVYKNEFTLLPSGHILEQVPVEGKKTSR
ncbi:MAG: hypothetical protein ABII90_09465 [Bacteroidota bacterium]